MQIYVVSSNEYYLWEREQKTQECGDCELLFKLNILEVFVVYKDRKYRSECVYEAKTAQELRREAQIISIKEKHWSSRWGSDHKEENEQNWPIDKGLLNKFCEQSDLFLGFLGAWHISGTFVLL